MKPVLETIMRRLSYILPVVTLAAGLLAQTGDNRLTNAEIESMLMAGLPESTIQMKIEAAALRGLVRPGCLLQRLDRPETERRHSSGS